MGKRNQRGFTGHEHLDEFALIHMNGRAYDFNLGRFYGVDPFIQFPSNSQSLNPYGYLMNNPLAGTDPTGYLSCSKVSTDQADSSGTCTNNGKTVKYSFNSKGDLGVASGKGAAGLASAAVSIGVANLENGARAKYGQTPVSQTDGSKRGSENLQSIGEPADVTDEVTANPNILRKGYPKLSQSEDGQLRTINFGDIPVSAAPSDFIPENYRKSYLELFNWVPYEPSSKQIERFITHANAQWNNTVYRDFEEGKFFDYKVVANFRLATSGEQSLLRVVGFHFDLSGGSNDVSNQGIGKHTWIGLTNFEELLLVGHEVAHFFGLGHQFNFTGRLSSYGDPRALSWNELHRLYKSYDQVKKGH